MKNLLYLAIVACPLIFFTDTTRNPYVIQGTLLYVLLLLIFCLFIIQSIRTGKIVFYKTRLDIPILVFLGWTIFTFVRALFCDYTVVGFGKIPGFSTAAWSEGLRNNLYILINCVLAYYVSTNLIRGEKTIKKVIFFYFLVSFVASIYAILQYFDMEMIWPQMVNPYGLKRCVSTFGNPVFLSSFLVIMIPVAVAMFVSAKSSFIKFLLVSLTAIMALALFATMARSSWIGLSLALVFIAVVFRDKIVVHKKWLFGFVLVLCLCMLIPTKWGNETKSFGHYIKDRAVSVFSLEKSGSAAYQRFLIWLSAWDISKQNPVVGCGWGIFEMLYPFYQQRYLICPTLNMRTHANNTHNVFLENLSQMGIIGLGIFLWLVVCIIKFGLHQIKNLPTTGLQKTIAVGIFAGTIGMFVDNVVNVTLYFVIPGFFFWTNLGVLAGMGATEKRTINHTTITKIIFSILVLILVLLGISQISIFYGEKNYFTGFKLSKRPGTPIEQAVPYLEKANRLHRLEVNNNYELANAYARMAIQFRNANLAPQADAHQKKAIWAYNEAIAANPGYDELYFNMATIYAQRQEFDAAEENYKRTVFINPLSLDAVMGLGNIYLFREKYEMARSCYRRATFIDQSNKDIWNNLGYVNIKLNRIDEAKECCQKALSIDPNFEPAKKNLLNIESGRR